MGKYDDILDPASSGGAAVATQPAPKPSKYADIIDSEPVAQGIPTPAPTTGPAIPDTVQPQEADLWSERAMKLPTSPQASNLPPPVATPPISVPAPEPSIAESQPGVKSFLTQLKDAWSRGDKEVLADIMDSQAMRGKRDPNEVAAYRKQLADLERTDPIAAESFMKQSAIGVARMLPGMVRGLQEGFGAGTGAAVGAAVAGQMGPQVATPEEIVTVPGAFVAGEAMGSAKFWMDQGSGAIYRDLLNAGVSKETAAKFAPVGGAPYALIEYSQVDKIIPGLGRMAKTFAKKSLLNGLLRITGRAALNVAHETGEEVVQQVVTDATETTAKYLDGVIKGSDLPAEAKRAAENAITTAKQTVGPMALLQLPGSAVASGAAVAETRQGVQTPPAAPAPAQAPEKPPAPKPAAPSAVVADLDKNTAKWEEAGAPAGLARELAKAEVTGDQKRFDTLADQFKRSQERKTPGKYRDIIEPKETGKAVNVPRADEGVKPVTQGISTESGKASERAVEQLRDFTGDERHDSAVAYGAEIKGKPEVIAAVRARRTELADQAAGMRARAEETSDKAESERLLNEATRVAYRSQLYNEAADAAEGVGTAATSPATATGGEQASAQGRAAEPAKGEQAGQPAANVEAKAAEVQAADQTLSKPQKAEPSGYGGVLDAKSASDFAERQAAIEKRTQRRVIPSDLASALRSDAAQTESSVNRPITRPDTLGNSLDVPTLLNKGYGSLDVPSRAAVLESVLSLVHDNEIFGAVVPSIPIDVMNKLAGKKFSAQDLLHDKAMFIHALSINDDLAVRGRAIDAIVRSPAITIAEIPIVPALADESSPASIARKVKIHGLPLTIENLPTSIRTGQDEHNRTWATRLKDAYGYVRGTEDNTGEPVDIFVNKDRPESGKVFVISQNKKDGTFDEYKAVAGAETAGEAKAIYERNYEPGWTGFGGVKEYTPDEFKTWLRSDGPKVKPTSKLDGGLKEKPVSISKSPELMTPDEYKATLPGKTKKELHYSQGMAIVNARTRKEPLNAEAVDAIGVKLQDGYVREGDLYVFKKGASDEEKGTQGQAEALLETAKAQPASQSTATAPGEAGPVSKPVTPKAEAIKAKVKAKRDAVVASNDERFPKGETYPPNSLIMFPVSFPNEERLPGFVAVPSTGLDAESIRADIAKAENAAEEKHNQTVSHGLATRFISGPDGKLTHAVSPSGRIAERGTPDASYILGDLQAHEKDRVRRMQSGKTPAERAGPVQEEIDVWADRLEKERGYLKKAEQRLADHLDAKKRGVAVRDVDSRYDKWSEFLKQDRNYVAAHTDHISEYEKKLAGLRQLHADIMAGKEVGNARTTTIQEPRAERKTAPDTSARAVPRDGGGNAAVEAPARAVASEEGRAGQAGVPSAETGQRKAEGVEAVQVEKSGAELQKEAAKAKPKKRSDRGGTMASMKDRSNLTGEFWLRHGKATSAAGDGDVNHQEVVMQQAAKDVGDALERNGHSDLADIIRSNAGDPVATRTYINDWLDSQGSDELYDLGMVEIIQKYMGKHGVSERIVQSLVEGADFDARTVGMQEYEWVRVAGNTVQTDILTGDRMREIARGLQDAYGDAADGSAFDIEVNKTKRFYVAVPYDVISAGDPSALRVYDHKRSGKPMFSLLDETTGEGVKETTDASDTGEAGAAGAEAARADAERGRTNDRLSEDDSRWQGWLEDGRREGRRANAGNQTAFDQVEVDASLGADPEFRAFSAFARLIGYKTVPITATSGIDGAVQVSTRTIYLSRSPTLTMMQLGKHELFHTVRETAAAQRLMDLVDTSSKAFQDYKKRLTDLHTAANQGLGYAPFAAKIKAKGHVTDELVSEEMAGDRYAGIARKYGVNIDEAFRDLDAANNIVGMIDRGMREQSKGDPDLFASMQERGPPVTPEQDARYLELAKDPEGNKAELQRMVETAARNAGALSTTKDGKPTTLWHYSRTGDAFSEFRIPAWFSRNRQYANEFFGLLTKENLSEKAQPFYIFKTPGEYALSLQYDAGVRESNSNPWRGETWMTKIPALRGLLQPEEKYVFNGPFLNQSGGVMQQPGVIEALAKRYPFMILKERGFDVYVALRPSIVKSADTTVRNEAGEIIPLSARFNPESPDIRFSMKDEPPSKDYAELLQKLEEARENMRRAIGTTQAVERQAGQEKTKKAVRRKVDQIIEKQKARLAAAQEEAGVKPPKTMPSTMAGIEAARQRVGFVAGKREGHVRAVEDVVNESFKLEAKARGVRYYDWAIEAGNVLEQYLFEDSGSRLTDEQRIANARIALKNIFGVDRAAAIRRASSGDYLAAIKSVRAFMDQRIGGFYVKAIKRLASRIRRDKLFPPEMAEFDALMESAGDPKEWKKKAWHESKDIYEQARALKASSDQQQKQLAEARSEQRESNAEVLLAEALAANKVIDPLETKPIRGVIKERMVDRQAAPDVLAATAFGGTKSHGAKIMVYRPRDGEDKANALAERARTQFYDALKALGIGEAEIARERGTRQEYDFYGTPLRMSPSQRRMFYWTTLDSDGRAKMIRNGFLVSDLKGQPSKSVKGPADDMETGIDAMQVATSAKDRAAVQSAIDAIKMVAKEARLTLIMLKGIDPLRDRGGTYAPLSIERSGQQRNLEENAVAAFDAFLEKWGRFEDRVRHKNPLLIVDFYTAVEDQIDRLSKVAHLAVPIRDAMQMLGHPEVGEAVRTRMGSLFETKMRDVYRQASGFDPVFRSPPSAMSPISRRAAAARLSALLTSILKNRYLGAGAAAFRIAMDNPGMAAKFLGSAIHPVPLWTASGKADVALMMKDGYFANRWKHDLIRALTAGPGKEMAGSTEFDLMWDRELIRGLRPMARAEMSNAAAMIRAARASGMSDAQAVEYAKTVTRETQNPSSAFDESDEYRKTRANPWKSLFFPFSGQRVVSRNLVHRAIIDAHYASPGGKDAAWRKVGLAAGALLMNLAGEYLLAQLLASIRNREGGDDEKKRNKRQLMAVVSNLADLAYPMGGGLAVDAVSSYVDGDLRGASTLVGQLFESVIRGTKKAVTADDMATRIKGIIEATSGGMILAGAPYVAGVSQVLGLAAGPALRTEDSKKRGYIQKSIDDLPDDPTYFRLNQALNDAFAAATDAGVVATEDEEGNPLGLAEQKARFTQSFYAQVEKKYGEEFKKGYANWRQSR